MDILILVVVVALGILLANLIQSSVASPQVWGVIAGLILLLIILVLVTGRPLIVPR